MDQIYNSIGHIADFQVLTTNKGKAWNAIKHLSQL
jgi:hypothetical protein